jgi:hypothetical protein
MRRHLRHAEPPTLIAPAAFTCSDVSWRDKLSPRLRLLLLLRLWLLLLRLLVLVLAQVLPRAEAKAVLQRCIDRVKPERVGQ